ncbi:M20 family metallopeptidase [bacterium]|nr:M20 family metallopeptidase [bacterium]
MNKPIDDQLAGSFRQIREQAERMLDDLIAIRRDIHAHPEVRFTEVRTAKIAADNLRNLGIDVQTGVGKTGVVGLLKGGLGEGKVLGIRCDMDALPTQEKSDVPYRSQNDGAMHACGHDVHTTVVIGVARILARMKDRFRGTVKFIFQPSEENPYKQRCGSLKMIDDGVLESPRMDAILSLHCWPDLDAGQVGVGPGPAMAAAEAFQVVLNGQQAHGATPQKGRDTMLGAAYVINDFYHITSRRTDPAESYALIINNIEGGNIQSVIGGKISLTGTVRTLSKESMEYINGLMKDAVDGIARILDLKGELIIDDFYPPVVNDQYLDTIISDAAASVLGPENVIVQKKCPMTAEDFSHFTDRVPGHYLKLGVANDEKGIRFPLHNDRFDVDERSIAVGVSVLASAALSFLSQDGS